MTEDIIVTDCWGELFRITPSLGLVLGVDDSQGFPRTFHTDHSVVMFLNTLSTFDLSLLSHRYSTKANHDDYSGVKRVILCGQLHVIPFDTSTASMRGVSASSRENFSNTNTNKLTTVDSKYNERSTPSRTLKVIRNDIRIALQKIIEQERTQSRKIEQSYKTKNILGKIEAHLQRFSKGLQQEPELFLTWVKDVNDVVSISQRLLRILMAAQASRHVDTDNRFELYQKLLSELEKKEIVEVLGFDPSLVSVEQITEVYSLTKLVYDDHTTRIIITHFIQDYITAQHRLEWREITGVATFEIILTAFIAVITGGVGTVASLGSQAIKLNQLKKLGTLLSELATLLKQVPKAKVTSLRKLKVREATEQRRKNSKHMLSEDVKTESHKKDQEPIPEKQLTNPQDIRGAAKKWPAEKKARFDIADEFYKQAGYKDYDSHLRGVDFDEPVKVVPLNKAEKLYQYSYLDRITGKPKVGAYYYSNTNVDVNKLGFEVGNRKMIEVEVGEPANFLQSTAANIEDWNGSGQIFNGGETQLFNPNATLSNVGIVK